MKVPFVHSNFARIEDDFYPTIDKRCVYGLVEHLDVLGHPKGPFIDVCAPNGSGIVDTLNSLGYSAACVPNAFMEDLKARWIVTNPPYKRNLVDSIISRQIKRIKDGDVFGVAMLLRVSFSFARGRTHLFRDNEFYWGRIELLFRPWWSEDRKSSPIHNYVWQIWTNGAYGDDAQYTLFSSGDNPK